MVEEERDLLVAWQHGDHAAGGELLRRYMPAVRRFFAGKVDVVAADDLAQRTFEALVRRRDGVRTDTSVRAYLLGMARLELLRHIDEWRRRGSRFDPLVMSLQASGRGPVSVIDHAQATERVAAALREIPLDFQIATEMFYWQDLTLAEIAAALEIPIGTVKSRLARARGMIARALEVSEADGERMITEAGRRDTLP